MVANENVVLEALMIDVAVTSDVKSLLDAPEMILGNVLREKTGVDAVVTTKM